MKPTRSLPASYHSVGSFDLRNNPKALLQLNVWGLVLFIVSAWGFTALLAALRPDEIRGGFVLGFSSLGGILSVLLIVVVVLVVMIVLHEAVHGFFFLLFTRSVPRFAFKGVYAYAAAPDWYLPKFEYLVVALAPLLLLSAAGVGLMVVVPQAWFLILLIFLVMNASGAVGDLWVVGWLLRQPNACYANDHGDAVTLYVEESAA